MIRILSSHDDKVEENRFVIVNNVSTTKMINEMELRRVLIKYLIDFLIIEQTG